MTQPHYIDRTLADRLDKAADAQPLLLSLPPQETAVAKLLREAAKAIRAHEAPMEAVAWRYRESADQDWTYEDHTPQHTPYRVGRMRRTVFPDFQALAVIPTEGGGRD